MYRFVDEARRTLRDLDASSEKLTSRRYIASVGECKCIHGRGGVSMVLELPDEVFHAAPVLTPT